MNVATLSNILLKIKVPTVKACARHAFVNGFVNDGRSYELTRSNLLEDDYEWYTCRLSKLYKEILYKLHNVNRVYASHM